MARRSPLQQNLFGTATISNENGGRSGFLAAQGTRISKKRKHVEDNFRKDIERAAALMDLPCIHIEYYCGNKFWIKCHACGKLNLAHCQKTINKGLKGQPDIIGVGWVVETKTARNKKGEPFKPTPEQQDTLEYYKKKNIPVLLLSNAESDEAIRFLRQLSINKTGRDPIAK